MTEENKRETEEKQKPKLNAPLILGVILMTAGATMLGPISLMPISTGLAVVGLVLVLIGTGMALRNN